MGESLVVFKYPWQSRNFCYCYNLWLHHRAHLKVLNHLCQNEATVHMHCIWSMNTEVTTYGTCMHCIWNMNYWGYYGTCTAYETWITEVTIVCQMKPQWACWCWASWAISVKVYVRFFHSNSSEMTVQPKTTSTLWMYSALMLSTSYLRMILVPERLRWFLVGPVFNWLKVVFGGYLFAGVALIARTHWLESQNFCWALFFAKAVGRFFVYVMFSGGNM